MKSVTWDSMLCNIDTVLVGLDGGMFVYILGYTPVCEEVLYLLSGKRVNIKVFDDDAAGKNTVGGRLILPFVSGHMPIYEVMNAIIIVTHDLGEEKKAEVLSGLKQIGFKRCYHVKDFILLYMLSKVYADYQWYSELNRDADFMFLKENAYLIIDEWCESAGTPLNTDYAVQDLWGARKVFGAKPEKHYDIGSRVDGFITHLLSFEMPTVLIDIRPLKTYGTENLTFVQADATTLRGIPDGSVESLSALCSLEHFGLGRYGDPIDPDAHLKAFESIQRVMKKGGNLYISLPVGDKCYVQFNAQRIYTPRYVAGKFNSMELIEFSICGMEGLERNASMDMTQLSTGLFHFRKK